MSRQVSFASSSKQSKALAARGPILRRHDPSNIPRDVLKYLRHPTLSVVPFDHTTFPKCLGCCKIIPVGELEEHLATCTLLAAYHRHVDPMLIVMQEQLDNPSHHDEDSTAAKSDLPNPSKILSLPGPQNMAPLLNTIEGSVPAPQASEPNNNERPQYLHRARIDTFHIDCFGQWYNEDGERFEVPFLLDSSRKNDFPNQEIVSFETGNRYNGLVHIYYVKIRTNGLRKEGGETIAAKRSPPYPAFPPGRVITYTQQMNGRWFDDCGNELSHTPINPSSSPVGMRVLKCTLYPGTKVFHKLKIKWFDGMPNDYDKIEYLYKNASNISTTTKNTSNDKSNDKEMAQKETAQKETVASTARLDMSTEGNDSLDESVSSPPKKKTALALPSAKEKIAEHERVPTAPCDDSIQQRGTEEYGVSKSKAPRPETPHSKPTNTYRLDNFIHLPNGQWFHEDGFEVETPLLLRDGTSTPPRQHFQSIGMATTPNGSEFVSTYEVRTDGVDKSAPCPSAIPIQHPPDSPSDRYLTYLQRESGGWTDEDGIPVASPEWLYNQAGRKLRHFSVYPGTTKVHKISVKALDDDKDDGSDDGNIRRMILDATDHFYDEDEGPEDAKDGEDRDNDHDPDNGRDIPPVVSQSHSS